MTDEIDYNVRLSLKIRCVVSAVFRTIGRHLLLVCFFNVLIAICYNYMIRSRVEEELNIVAYSLRGTFVSSLPSCIALILLLCCTEYNWNVYSYKEWNLMNVCCGVLTFYSVTFTKAIFCKEFVSIYEVVYLTLLSYLLEGRINCKKRNSSDYEFYVKTNVEDTIQLFKKGMVTVVPPLVITFFLGLTLDILLTAVVDNVSINILLSIITHPFEIFLNIPKIYSLTNSYQVEGYSFFFCAFSSIWITALIEYHFIMCNFVVNKYDSSILTIMKNFPVHNKAPYVEEYFVVSCVYNYLKDISYKMNGWNIEITNMDKMTKLKLLLFKKIMLLNVHRQKKLNNENYKYNYDMKNIMKGGENHFRNPINSVLLEDTQIWATYVHSCILCIEDLMEQFKKYINILNYDEKIYNYEEKEMVRCIFQKSKIQKLKDTIRLVCMYFKGMCLWTIVVNIICRSLISSYVRKMAAVLVGLSFVVFDFLNFVKIRELYDTLHMLLYEMNALIEVFKFYKDDVLDNKYQYSYNLYKGLSYLLRHQTLRY